jgi:multidrug efflux pump subunit AcrA (membrane-fusion protein)
MQKLLKRALTVVPIVAALLVVAYLVTHKPGPVQRQTTEAVQTLRVIAAPVVDWVPRAVGYGVAAPGTVWEAVAEAQGKIAAIHPLLKSGEVIAAQTVLVRIDPVEYELAVARLEAGVEETHANIRTLDEEQANTRLLMVIEQRSLELARQSLARKRTALARKAISQDEVDREERNVLLQQQQLRQIENTLALMPSRRKALDAALVVQQSHLEQARIDLTKTSIAAPFNCRLAEVRLEVGQYVRAGQTLFLAHGTNTTEIEARFSVEALRNLLGEERRGQFQPGLGTGTVQEIFGDVRVLISLESGDWSAQWDGRIERLRNPGDESRGHRGSPLRKGPTRRAPPFDGRHVLPGGAVRSGAAGQRGGASFLPERRHAVRGRSAAAPAEGPGGSGVHSGRRGCHSLGPVRG